MSYPLNDLLIELLKRRQNGIHPFDISGDRVYRLIKKYYLIAEIANANVHTLRKTCGSLLVQNGVDIYRVSKWLGHSSVSVTEKHYINILKKDYEDIALLLDQTSSEFEIEKVLPYSCHNTDQTRLIETKRQTKSENGIS